MAAASPFSYRLKIAVEPQWAEIIKRVVGLKNEEEQNQFGAKIKEHLQDDRMLHRNYDFTEFFDASSGLTMKFRRVHTDEGDGKTFSGFVSEFRDAGYLFGHNNSLMPEDQKIKYQIEVSEHSIRTECFDPHSGGINPFGGDMLFAFPIDAILEFGIALQLRFPDLNMNHVLKWPDKIEKALESKETKFETMFDYTPDERNIESEDREFFLRYGKPKIATVGGWPASYFIGPCCYYCVELEVFTPETAKRFSRLATSSFTRENLFGE
jgi:hypothetical protein